MKQFNTREEVLQDTINYYWGRPERFCVKENGICSYTPQGKSEGCAVGRLAPREVAEALAKTNLGIIITSQFDLLPQWMRDLGQGFWSKLQIIHDHKYLSKMDHDRIKEIMSVMEIDISKITFPKV
jgi:hypothetical protein